MEQATRPVSWLYRLRRFMQTRRWVLIGLLWLFTLALGYVGFSRYAEATGIGQTRLDALYLSVQLFVLNSGSVPGPKPWELEVARLLAPVVAGVTAIQALALLFAEEYQSLQLRFVRDHVILCGLGRRGSLLAHSFQEQGHRVVVIEQDANNDAIDACRQLGIVVLIGNPAHIELLERAGALRARYLIAACDDDGVNAEIAVQARRLSSRRTGPPLSCMVHLVQPQLCALLHDRSFDPVNYHAFRLEFFNTFDLGARILLEKFPPLKQGQAGPPHMLIVGFGSLGQSLAIRAARTQCWNPGLPGGRLRITVLDREAEDKVKLISLRYPRLPETCDLIPCQMDTRGPEFQEAGFLRDESGRFCVTTIYILFDDEAQALVDALTLAARLRDEDIPIIVRTTRSGGLASLLYRDDASSSYSNLYAFPLLEHSCAPDLVLGGMHETVARALHQRYVQQRADQGQTPASDPSMVPWEQLTSELRESNRTQADGMSAILRSAGYGLAPLTDWDAWRFRFPEDDVELMARLEHERYVAERLRDGWSLGPKDNIRKTNPNLVPWEQLTADAQERARHALRELPCILAEAGLEVYPLRAERQT